MNILKKFFESFTSGNTLYYPGCLTKFVAKDLLQNYRVILRKIGIDFIELEGVEMCCGSPVRNAGEEEEFINLAQKNLDIFNQYGVSRIITSCPACYKVLSQDYPEVLGDKWNIQVEQTTKLIAAAIASGKLKVADSLSIDGKITYHDPCHLGRYCGIYEEPREIIRKIAEISKGTLVEMVHNRENALCCGGGGGLGTNFNQTAGKIGELRISEARETDAQILCTSCPMCYLHLLKSVNSEKDLKVLEVSSLLIDKDNRNEA